MKGKKIVMAVALAAVLFMPMSGFARSHFSFSLNLFDVLAPRPCYVVPLPPPIIEEHIYVPYVPEVRREYHYYPQPRPPRGPEYICPNCAPRPYYW
ncbi:MAG: hypothetical protein K940chlam9_00936 [Chlamydiae bacterium]|nr:hypothetical protein [Chlamydiota bacterium]